MVLLVPLLAESQWIERKTNRMVVVLCSKLLRRSKEKHVPVATLCSGRASVFNKKEFGGSIMMRRSYLGMTEQPSVFNGRNLQPFSTNKRYISCPLNQINKATHCTSPTK